MSQPDDVEIVLAPDRRLQFNSGILTRNSTLFALLLTERSAAKLSTKARNAGIKLRWMVELTSGPTDEEPSGRLELVVRNQLTHDFTSTQRISKTLTSPPRNSTQPPSPTATSPASSPTKTDLFPVPAYS